MKTLVTGGIGIVVIGLAVWMIPSLKGPFNRIRNNANEALDSEYVVDNYKAEYVSLHSKREGILKSINRFNADKAVAEKKLAYAVEKSNVAKQMLVRIGTADIKTFSKAKDAYEAALTEIDNFKTMISAYSNALVKLDSALNLVETNMNKAKMNVTVLESKKVLVDNIKAVNETVESLNGIGDSSMGISVEKLDDDVLRESIKLEALNETASKSMTKEEAAAYIESLK